MQINIISYNGVTIANTFIRLGFKPESTDFIVPLVQYSASKAVNSCLEKAHQADYTIDTSGFDGIKIFIPENKLSTSFDRDKTIEVLSMFLSGNVPFNVHIEQDNYL